MSFDTTSIYDMPKEILGHIFAATAKKRILPGIGLHIKTDHLIKLESVCKAWLEICRSFDTDAPYPRLFKHHFSVNLTAFNSKFTDDVSTPSAVFNYIQSKTITPTFPSLEFVIRYDLELRLPEKIKNIDVNQCYFFGDLQDQLFCPDEYV